MYIIIFKKSMPMYTNNEQLQKKNYPTPSTTKPIGKKEKRKEEAIYPYKPICARKIKCSFQ